MAAKLKEFSIFNVSIEFGFMNSKIIDQHFCRDALSISRHVGRRVFFCCCLKYFLTCPTSQIDGVAQNLCVFLGSRPNIFESFVTSPMFAVRSCYKSILSIAISFHPLSNLQDSMFKTETLLSWWQWLLPSDGFLVLERGFEHRGKTIKAEIIILDGTVH